MFLIGGARCLPVFRLLGGRNKPTILSAAMCLIYFVLVVSELRCALCAVFLLVHYQRMESVHQVYTILLHSYVVPLI